MTKNEAKIMLKTQNNYYFNDDLKKIAYSIIDNISESENVRGYFDFIASRVGIGFKYDVSPELETGEISFVKEDKKRNINIGDQVDINENKLIIGENYEALKNLLLTHENEIDIIYVDPPYNTESAKREGNYSYTESKSSKLLYKDKIERNGWLNIMRERFLLAKKLMSDNGFLFISIDDHEQAYLKIILDDIFDTNSFLGCFPRATSFPNHLKKDAFSQVNDYVLIYSKRGAKLKTDCKRVLQKSKNSLENETQKNKYLFTDSRLRNTEANRELKSFDLYFSFPKPTSLIEEIIKLVPVDKNQTIVLDFFAGSGTTGHAVMQLNKKDGGNRKFILCTNNESKIATKILLPKMNKVIIENCFNKSDEKHCLNEKLRVFSLKKIKYSNDKKIRSVDEEVKKNLRLLNPKFSSILNRNFYYELSSLNRSEYKSSKDK